MYSRPGRRPDNSRKLSSGNRIYRHICREQHSARHMGLTCSTNDTTINKPSMKKLITAIFVLISFFGSAFAQKKPEVYIQTDLTSAYLWRGEKIAGVSIQPSVGLKWRGLHFYVWANEQLSPPSDEPLTHEIDLVLKYSVTSALEVGLRNVYLNTRGAGFFSYGSIPHAANGLDMFVAYVQIRQARVEHLNCRIRRL